MGPCLAIPFRDATGKRLDYCRLKPDRPRKNKDGRPIKYESPKGSTNQPFFPPRTLAVLGDPSQPLVITEGEKKSAKADQEGFPCIGLVGVYGWQKKRPRGDNGATGERELINGLACVPWQGRTVYLCYDSDAAHNPNVIWGEWNLAAALVKRGAVVKVVRLPPGEKGADGKPAKVGLDDFLVANGPEAFRDLLHAARVPRRPAGAAGIARDRPNEADDDPHRLARLCLWDHIRDQFREAGGVPPKFIKIRYWQEEWVEWDGKAYRKIPAKEMRARVTGNIKTEFDRLNLEALKEFEERAKGKGEKEKDKEEQPPEVGKVNAQIVTNTLQALSDITLLPSTVEPSAWINGAGPFSATEVLATPNALIHLPTLVNGKGEYSCPPTLNFFSFNVLDYDFDAGAPEPKNWLAFLGDLWPDDPQSISTLQEWMGYLLTPDTRQQKILMLVGPKRSGKGTIARVITGMLGRQNVAGPTLFSLGTNFGLWPLLGKTAAIISDARLSGRTDAATVTERLLSISGEDSLTVDRKNLSPVTAKLPTRFMILTNELPKLGDASGALTGRMVLLRQSQSWYGKEDTRLTDRLLQELPGILLWAIEGWRRLRERGHFVQPDASKELLGELEDLSSPVGAFVRECCLVGPGYRVAIKELFSRWKKWAEEKGREHPGDEQTFGRNLRAAVPNLGTSQPRQEDYRIRVYEGIALKDG